MMVPSRSLMPPQPEIVSRVIQRLALGTAAHNAAAAQDERALGDVIHPVSLAKCR
jgi:hypothetical protein